MTDQIEHPPLFRPHSLNNSLLRGITIIDGLMLVIILLAAVPRFYELGRLALSPAEAGAALASWQFTHGQPMTAEVTSPAYFTLTNILMAAGATGDAIARFFPALLGLLTVLLTWLWRGHLRPVVYLVTSTFLAASPLLIHTSRTAGGEAVALFALMLMITARLNLSNGGRGWANVFGAAIGLGLLSAPVFYSGLLVLAIAYWVYAGQFGNGKYATLLSAWRWIALGAAAAFVIISTSFLTYPAGLGTAVQLLGRWFGQFGLPGITEGGLWSLLSPFLSIIRYEPALLLLGLPAVLLISRQNANRETAGFDWHMTTAVIMATAFGLGLLIILFQPEIMTNALVLLLPGYMLVGLLANRVMIGELLTRNTWGVAGGLLLLGMVLLISIGRFTKLGLWSGGQVTLLSLGVVAFVFAAIVVLVMIAWDNPAARQGIFIGLSLLLLYFQWGTAWQLGLYSANDPRERWVTVGTDDDVTVMTELIQSVSRQLTNSDTDISVLSLVDSPVLRWYLREYQLADFSRTAPLTAQHALVIAPAEAELQLSTDYIGTDFTLVRQEMGPAGNFSIGDVLNWWLFRQSSMPTTEERIIVWLRADVATAP